MTRDLTLDALLHALLHALANLVADKLADRLPAPTSGPELWDGPATAGRLGISLQKLDRMRKAGQVPYVPLGRSIRYELGAVIDALRGGSSAADIDPSEDIDLPDGPEHIADLLKRSKLGRSANA